MGRYCVHDVFPTAATGCSGDGMASRLRLFDVGSSLQTFVDSSMALRLTLRSRRDRDVLHMQVSLQLRPVLVW